MTVSFNYKWFFSVLLSLAIQVMLFTQFSTLKYVYVIKNRLAIQQASLEASKPKIE
jgi:hypothetical protein